MERYDCNLCPCFRQSYLSASKDKIKMNPFSGTDKPIVQHFVWVNDGLFANSNRVPVALCSNNHCQHVPKCYCVPTTMLIALHALFNSNPLRRLLILTFLCKWRGNRRLTTFSRSCSLHPAEPRCNHLSAEFVLWALALYFFLIMFIILFWVSSVYCVSFLQDWGHLKDRVSASGTEMWSCFWLPHSFLFLSSSSCCLCRVYLPCENVKGSETVSLSPDIRARTRDLAWPITSPTWNTESWANDTRGWDGWALFVVTVVFCGGGAWTSGFCWKWLCLPSCWPSTTALFPIRFPYLGFLLPFISSRIFFSSVLSWFLLLITKNHDWHRQLWKDKGSALLTVCWVNKWNPIDKLSTYLKKAGLKVGSRIRITEREVGRNSFPFKFFSL